jgi:DNA-binding response OmpR family regulator
VTPAPAAPAATVLVVDDEAPVRQVLERALIRYGYQVLTAADAEAAYDLLGVQPVDAILLDIHLPTMSGLALYLAMENRWPDTRGRIALMSGDAEAHEVAVWLAHHECTVIRKPFDLREVLAWVVAVTRARGRQLGNG